MQNVSMWHSCLFPWWSSAHVTHAASTEGVSDWDKRAQATHWTLPCLKSIFNEAAVDGILHKNWSSQCVQKSLLQKKGGNLIIINRDNLSTSQVKNILAFPILLCKDKTNEDFLSFVWEKSKVLAFSWYSLLTIFCLHVTSLQHEGSSKGPSSK